MPDDAPNSEPEGQSGAPVDGIPDIESQAPSWIALALIGLGVILVQGVAGIIIYALGPDWSTRGTFGDMFGAVNALFSGLAFAGVIYALFLQRRELELQRRELAMSRNELRRSAAAQESSQAALAEQVDMLRTSARLSAITALVDNYGRQIQVVDEERTSVESLRATGSLGDFQYFDRVSDVERRREILADKHEALVSELENLVRENV